MNEIKAGDKVLNPGFGERTVVAVDGNSAWIRDKDGWQCVAKLSNLTRIEPEPVVLTPKYGVGQRVNFIGQGKVHLAGVEVGYHIEKWGGLWPESLLEPVPEPCDKCKGSGVASE